MCAELLANNKTDTAANRSLKISDSIAKMKKTCLHIMNMCIYSNLISRNAQDIDDVFPG